MNLLSFSNFKMNFFKISISAYQTLCLVFGKQWHWITFLSWAFYLFERKGLKEPTLSQFLSARFKILVDYQMLTITQFSGWGKGNVAQNKDNFTGGTEGKLCHMKRGL